MTYLKKLQKAGIGFELRYIQTQPFTIVSSNHKNGKEVKVVNPNGKEWEGTRKLIKQELHTNSGKWRVKFSSNDGSISQWDKKDILGDTMEEVLKKFYNKEVKPLLKLREQYQNVYDNDDIDVIRL